VDKLQKVPGQGYWSLSVVRGCMRVTERRRSHHQRQGYDKRRCFGGVLFNKGGGVNAMRACKVCTSELLLDRIIY